uniref:C2 domain-containing protein n=1 Tax=Syphacia muris TaxID=451379 RepID=A0A0N5AWX2_9BILA
MDLEQLEQTLYGNVEEDEDLLAELYAMEAEEKSSAVKKPLRSAQPSSTTAQLPPKGVSNVLLSQDIQNALADPDSDSDEDLDDPELLAEFSTLMEGEAGNDDKGAAVFNRGSQPPPPVVNTPLLQKLRGLEETYKKAVSAAVNNAPKSRRYQRILDKIYELIKKAERGIEVNEEEIPIAPVGFACSEDKASNMQKTLPVTHNPPPLPPRPKVSDGRISTELASTGMNKTDKESLGISGTEKNSEKCLNVNPSTPKLPTEQSSLQHETSPGSSHCLKANEMLKILKERREAYLKNAKEANDANDKHAAFGFYTVVKQFDQAIAVVNSGEVLECDESELPPLPKPYQPIKNIALTTPKNFLEGLNQRMTLYKNLCQQNKKDGDDRKFRMNSRIVKRYEEAIKAYTAKQPYNFYELPCPPGCPPLPPYVTNNTAVSIQKTVPQGSGKEMPSNTVNSISTIANKPRTTTKAAHTSQIDFLLKRQLQFKQAAVVAKQRNDLTSAKKYLLAAKNFTTIIANVQAGKHIDLNKLPVPPQIQTSTVKPEIKPKEVEPEFDVIEGSREDIFATLEKDLLKQLKRCDESRIIFTKLGDFKQVEFFEELFRETKMDLLYLRQLAKTNSTVPKFRYEIRDFPSMQLCADVSEDHLELSVVRVMDAKLPSGWRASLLCFAPYMRHGRIRHNEVPSWKPSDGNIFVKFEFAFPHSAHQSGKTKIVAGTNSPDFCETVLLGINRKSKQLLRTIKRNCLKFEVYQKGGFLRSDRLLGVADCKLALLETKAQIHEAVELMEGRRLAGGKIEYKVRIREPLGEKKLSLVQEKWLVLIKTA